MNVLWLVMDDARRDIVETMPTVRSLARRGTTFTRAVAETPVCYSVRANLLVGQSAARTDIVDWFGSDIPSAISAGRWSYDWSFASWVDLPSLAVGKYLNTADALTPAGWTRFRQPSDSHAHIVTSVNNGDGEGFQSIDPIWHTDWALGEIAAHIAASAGDWLVYWATNAPHSPHGAIPGDPFAWSHIEAPRYPQDGTGWPSWITDRDPVTNWGEARRVRRAMIREAYETDQALASLLDGIDLDDTLVIVTSDNGAHQGDHRILGAAQKNTIYEQAYGVPLVIAGPGFPAGASVDVPVILQDITATVSAATDSTPPRTLDGVDLRRVAAYPHLYKDRAVLGRRRPVGADPMPGANWVYTGALKMARHYQHVNSVDPTGEEYELYDLFADPGELVNLAYDPEWAATRDVLEVRLDEMLTPA